MSDDPTPSTWQSRRRRAGRIVNVRLTTDERALLERAALAASQPLSTFIRAAALEAARRLLRKAEPS